MDLFACEVIKYGCVVCMHSLGSFILLLVSYYNHYNLVIYGLSSCHIYYQIVTLKCLY